MSQDGLEGLDRSLQLAHEWINALDAALGWHDRHRSYRLLRAVLQVLRDCLPLAETAHFSAQLPLVLRGVFFEQWRPAAERPAHWDLDRFFAKIAFHFAQDPLEEADLAVTEVFALFESRLSLGEIAHVVSCLPAEIRALWPSFGEN